MRSLILLLSLAFCMPPLSAQHYKTAAGLRLGNTYGLTVVQALNKRWTAEALIHRNFDQLNYLNAMGRYHRPLFFFTRTMNLYYGAGMHLGFGGASEGNMIYGLDGVIGVELTMFHVNLSLDYKPTIDFGQEQWFRNYAGVSARYVIIEANWRDRWRKVRKKRQRKRKNYNGR
jgi:hypothetical protein